MEANEKHAPPTHSPCMCQSGEQYRKCCRGKISPEQEEYYGLLYKQFQIRERILSLLESKEGRACINKYMQMFAKGIEVDMEKWDELQLNRFFDWLFNEARSLEGEFFSAGVMDSFPDQFNAVEKNIVGEWDNNSFPGVYEVLGTDKEKWNVEIQEIVSGKKYSIMDKRGSELVPTGTILFNALNQIFGQYYFSGILTSYSFPCKEPFKDFIMHEWEKAGGKSVISYGDFMKSNRLKISSFEPPQPHFLNRLGEDVKVCEATYRIHLDKERIVHWFMERPDEYEVLKVHGRNKRLKAEITILQPSGKPLHAVSRENDLIITSDLIDPQGNATPSIGSIRIEKSNLVLFSTSESVFRKIQQLLLHSFSGKITLEQEKIVDANEIDEHENQEKNEREEDIPEEFQKGLTKYLEKHYVEWCDQEIPALGNMTPRQIIKTKEGMERLESLLQEFEHDPIENKINVSPVKIIRKELGI